MSNPIERIKGEIVDYNEHGEMIIKAQYDNTAMLLKRQYKYVEIQLIDNRPLSDKQRNMCWALIGAIADWQGQSRSETQKDLVNEARKLDFLINEINENADALFSLSNAPMSLIYAYQKYLVHFVIANDIPTKKALLEYVDDINDYVYQCLIHKKCAVCGKFADLHHIDTVGMGRNREEIIHEGMEVISLCRQHHTEAHTLGNGTFLEKYHFNGGIELDKTLCKIYKIKRRKENE